MDPEAIPPAGATWPTPSELTITWGDGHRSTYGMRYLREHCPCAGCKVERIEGPRGRDLTVPVPTEPGMASPVVSVVGRYALRFAWRDGHDTGIYPFEFLRQLCPCDACKVA